MVNLRLQVLLPASMILNLSTSEPYFVFQISQPPNLAQIWFCIQNLQMDISFKEKKKQFVNMLDGLQVKNQFS